MLFAGTPDKNIIAQSNSSILICIQRIKAPQAGVVSIPHLPASVKFYNAEYIYKNKGCVLMYFDGPSLLAHYQRWLTTYREPIEEKLTTALSHRDQKQAMHNAMEVLLTEVMPMAIAEMILFNNGRLEEAMQEKDGGCSSCATNLK
ncbi:MAG: hypothetical protein H6Q71_586 [Firmicutes bacterium]|nr:hypothetical protein [Bacillota bacterium]